MLLLFFHLLVAHSFYKQLIWKFCSPEARKRFQKKAPLSRLNPPNPNTPESIHPQSRTHPDFKGAIQLPTAHALMMYHVYGHVSTFPVLQQLEKLGKL